MALLARDAEHFEIFASSPVEACVNGRLAPHANNAVVIFCVTLNFPVAIAPGVRITCRSKGENKGENLKDYLLLFNCLTTPFYSKTTLTLFQEMTVTINSG